MKKIRKIYDRAFKEKAIQLSYERHNITPTARKCSIVDSAELHSVPFASASVSHLPASQIVIMKSSAKVS